MNRRLVTRPQGTMTGAAARAAGGFTLVEILIGTAVLMVVGGTAGLLLMRAFTLWEHGVARTRTLAATEEAAVSIARDFASLQGGMGLVGDSAMCRFWSLEIDGAATPRLVAVDYEIKPSVVIRRAIARGEAAAREWRFAPVESLTLHYGAREASSDEWLDAWSNPTNAPARLGLRFRGRRGPAATQPLLRRTP